MKKLLVIINIFLLSSTVTFGQLSKKNILKPIIISGYIPDSCLNTVTENPEIFFHDNFNVQLWHEAKIYPLKIVNNRFTVTIQPQNEISYFQFKTGINSLSLLSSIEYDAYLVNAGDKIFINFRTPNKVTFSGIGSEKFNYQENAANVIRSWGTLRGMNGYKPEYITYFKQLADEHLRTCMDSLNKIKTSMSWDTYKVLKFNTSSAINSAYIAAIQSNIIRNNFTVGDSIYLKRLESEMISLDIQQRGFSTTDTVVINHASAYISYLVDFLETYNEIFTRKRFSAFNNIFEKIKSEYTGQLRDKLLAYSINKHCTRLVDPQIIQEAIRMVNDPISEKLIKKIYNSKVPGVKAYDFSFEDIHGKQLKLQDLRGKVVILEAWFNGCSGCVGLASHMHPVLEHFKTNKNVVFISLGVDRDKRRFLDGVKSGKYGSENSVYLYTNGKGWEHPMCLQYQWDGYPNMLIIDKNGKLITAEKKDPLNEEKKKELIALIEKGE